MSRPAQPWATRPQALRTQYSPLDVDLQVGPTIGVRWEYYVSALHVTATDAKGHPADIRTWSASLTCCGIVRSLGLPSRDLRTWTWAVAYEAFPEDGVVRVRINPPPGNVPGPLSLVVMASGPAYRV